MAGEIQLNSTSFASESGGTITINNATIGSAVAMAANQACVKTAINASGSAPIYACRAWVNFNGTGTVAIREYENVSSITDNGTGNYTVNFTTAMPDANYVVASIGSAGSTESPRTPTIVAGDTKSTTQLQIRYMRSDSTLSDQENCFLAIFR